MMTLRNSTSWLAIAGAITVLATPAVAQQAVPADQQSTDQGSDISDPVAKAAAQRRAAITGQGAADTDDSNIVVTGTRISRPNLASAAPITSVTVQDIQAQAPLNVEEVLNRLPQIAPDSQQNYQDSDGRQRIKLRSLGFERTLVLIDGKRLGTQNAQDTGIIPTSLLQRIDVLSGGASSVYGSDAISGVVNFVLRQDFDGLRIDGNYNFYNHVNKNTIVSPIARAAGFATPTGLTNDGGRADLTLTAGKKLFDDTLKISGFVNYRTADLVSYGARSTAPCYILQAAKDGPLTCQLSTYSPSGYIAPNSGPNAGRALVNNPDGTRTFIPYGAGANNAANPYDTYAHQRASERYTAGGFVSYEISREAELYGSAIWFRDKSSNPSPRRVYSRLVFGGAPYDVNCNNPFLSTAQATALCGAAAGTAALAQTDIRYRFEGQPYQANRYVNEGIRATGGIRGRVGEAWNYDIGGVYARNQQDTINAPFSDDTRVRRSLNVVSVNGVPTCASAVSGVDTACVPFDAFRAGSGNAALTNYLFTGANGGRARQVGSLYDVLATMTGDLTSYGITSPWAEQGLAISLGTEYRKDHLVGSADQAFRDFSGGDDSDLKQDVWESNIEAQLPIVQNRRFAKLLQVNGGFRLSKYSSNPDVFNTWKIEGIYAPVEDLTFRASFNKAQRAPTVVEINQATTISYGTTGVTDFCAPVARQVADPANPGRQITVFDPPVASRETCRATGLSDALYGSQSLICTDNTCTIRGGGFTADPETAYTQTYGIVVKPRFLPGLVFSVDRYQIRINNSLGYNGADYFSEGCRASNGDPFFCSAFVRNPTTGILYAAPATNPTSGYIRVGTNNYYRSISNGWDFQAQYTLGLNSVGRLDWSFNGSLTTLAGGQDSPNRPQYNCAGYFSNGISCGQLLPKWMHGLRTTYTTSDNIFNASFNWRYTGALTSANNSGQEYIGGTPARAQTTFARIAPQSYFDLSLTFNIARQFALRFIANNLLDRVPPVISNSRTASLAYNNTLPQRYDSLGRQLAIGTTITF